MKIREYSWGNFNSDAYLIKEYINTLSICTIVGIAWGSLPLLTYLKNLFPFYDYKIVYASSYKNKKQKDLIIEAFIPILWESPILLVDEIVDSGETLKEIKNRLEIWGKKVITLSLFYKEGAKIKPDFYVRKVPKGVWVIMPWEE